MNNQQPNQTFWSGFKIRFRRFWRRFQLTRWLIVIFLTIVFVMSAYLTFMAKTANVGI